MPTLGPKVKSSLLLNLKSAGSTFNFTFASWFLASIGVLCVLWSCSSRNVHQQKTKTSHMNPDIAVWKQMSGSGIHVACVGLVFWLLVHREDEARHTKCWVSTGSGMSLPRVLGLEVESHVCFIHASSKLACYTCDLQTETEEVTGHLERLTPTTTRRPTLVTVGRLAWVRRSRLRGRGQDFISSSPSDRAGHVLRQFDYP